MSAAKRDNDEFRHAVSAAQAALRSTPRQSALRPGQAAAALGLQTPLSVGTPQGGDPYNSRGVRTRT